MRSRILCSCFALISAFAAGTECQTLHADIIVEVDGTQVTVDGLGTVDVWVYSNSGDVNVSAFGFDFDIVANPANVGSLSFSHPQSLTETADPDYIFFGEADPFHTLGDSALELEGSDFNTGVNGFSTVGSARKLLARLDVFHSLPFGTDPSLALGDVFTVSPNFTDGFFEFLDEFGDPDTIDINETLSSSGTITTSAAVPEPGTFVILLLGGVLWGGHQLRRKAKPLSPEAT